jgi:hypothetical protein
MRSVSVRYQLGPEPTHCFAGPTAGGSTTFAFASAASATIRNDTRVELYQLNSALTPIITAIPATPTRRRIMVLPGASTTATCPAKASVTPRQKTSSECCPQRMIRQYDVTDASVHDSQKFDGLLNKTNTSADVYADSAYRSAETEAKLKVRGLRSRILRNGIALD